MKRILKKIGKVILVLLAVLILAHGALTFVLGRRLEARLAELKAAGQPVSMSDLAGPPVPDSENAAVIYEQVFKEVSSPGYHKDAQSFPYSSMTWSFDKNPDWAAAKAAVERHEHILDLAQKANAMPKFRFRGNRNPISNEFHKSLSKEIELSRYLGAYAVVEAHFGNMDEAVRALDISIQSINKVREPLLIPYLVTLARVGRISMHVEDVLRYGNRMNEAQARRLFEAFGHLDLKERCNAALSGESARVFDGTETLFDTTHTPLPQAYLFHPWLYAERLAMSDQTQLLLRNSNLSCREMKDKGIVSRQAKLHFYTPHANNMAHAYARVVEMRDRRISYIGCSQIVLALQAYKDRFATYPETLAELNSRLGWKLPNDPFSGKPFIYKRRGQGFLLYSVGDNPRVRDVHLYPPWTAEH